MGGHRDGAGFSARSAHPSGFALFLVVMISVFAATFGSAETIHVPSEVGTLSEALALAETGDIVLVAPGTYEGEANRNLNFDGKDVVLMSSGGWSATQIDMGHENWATGQFVTCESGESPAAVIRGFRISGGCTVYGGAIRCTGGSSPSIEECYFDGNWSAVTDNWGIYWRPGGAIYIEDSSPTIRDCEFHDNHGRRGGAIAACGSSPLIESCLFYGNHAEQIHMSMTDTESGGGLWLTDGSVVTVADCQFIGNAAAAAAVDDFYTAGGAVYADDGAAATFVRCSFHGNHAKRAESISSGGSVLALTDCEFDEDRGAVLNWQGDLSVSGCTFTGPGGFALEFVSGEIEDCLFYDVPDSIIKVRGSGGVIRTSTIVGNSGPVFCVGGAVDIQESILAFGGSQPILNPGSNLDVHHCVVFGHASGDSLPSGHHDNLFVDPCFCDREGGDFTLCSDSPCLPAGNDWGLHVGALPAGCGPCNTVVEPVTWGRLKALYR